jgi:hypothetical protein
MLLMPCKLKLAWTSTKMQIGYSGSGMSSPAPPAVRKTPCQPSCVLAATPSDTMGNFQPPAVYNVSSATANLIVSFEQDM